VKRAIEHRQQLGRDLRRRDRHDLRGDLPMIAALLALMLPQVAQPIAIDEIAWRSPARTGPFTDAAGALAAPYSDARFLRDDRFLYLALHAADEDIRSTDEFVVKLGRTTYHFTAAGTPIKGVRLAVDRDGPLDAPADDDEEWSSRPRS
jgi:hypothetical protein